MRHSDSRIGGRRFETAVFDPDRQIAMLGIGKLVTSVTMTMFYLPVVLWAQTYALVGMLMLPKTCMYIWMIVMFIKTARTDALSAPKKE